MIERVEEISSDLQLLTLVEPHGELLLHAYVPILVTGAKVSIAGRVAPLARRWRNECCGIEPTRSGGMRVILEVGIYTRNDIGATGDPAGIATGRGEGDGERGTGLVYRNSGDTPSSYYRAQ